MSRDILARRLDADTFLSRHSAQPFERALGIEWSYKRECQETFFPVGSMPTLFCLGIQPNRLNVHSGSSGLVQANVMTDSFRSTQWRHFSFSFLFPSAFVTAHDRSELPRLNVIHIIPGVAW